MIYTDGTIAINAGSPIVTGTGTQWKKNIHGVAPGQLISIENGTAPVSMMIRAVNSDTELVLSFNSTVTLSGAKYSIATTVPDTISDAARTMSANQGYIVYFLQAMQQWMTDTGQVEIELPNGQKVTLGSIKALNDAISKIPKVVQETGLSETDVISQKVVTETINNAKPGDATTTAKGIVQLAATIGTSTTKVPHENAVSEALKSKLNTTGGEITGGLTVNGNDVLLSGSALAMLGAVTGYPTFTRRGVWGAGTESDYAKGINFGHSKDGMTSDTGRISITYKGEAWLRYLNTNGSAAGGQIALIGRDVAFDSGGFLKKSSPIIMIRPDGHYKTNDESEGAEVRRTGTGQYHITGILGYNSDGAWGVNGGISVPKDNNGLELVYVDDRVQEDGSLIIETCHRQHAHLPERFQNWRLKEITPEGERVFYQDGEPCDLPESTRLDVRVEMPQGSVWNVKQRELAEQMEREQAEREAQEAAEQGVDSDQ